MARAISRASCLSEIEPGTILQRVNRALSADIADELFMSMFLCVLDPESGDFVYANAGQTSPVLIHAASGESRHETATAGAVNATPLVVDGRLFCPSTDRRLHAVDLDSGRRKVVAQTQGKCYSSPSLIDGSVVFGSNDGGLRGIDPKNGSVELYGRFPERLLSAPRAYRDRILITGAGGSLLCVRRT